MIFPNIPNIVLANTFNDWVTNHNVVVNVVNTLLNGNIAIGSLTIDTNNTLTVNSDLTVGNTIFTNDIFIANNATLNGADLSGLINNAANAVLIDTESLGLFQANGLSFISSPTIAVSSFVGETTNGSGVFLANVQFDVVGGALQGVQGATGSQGRTGTAIQGITGIQGTTGAQGATGTSVQGIQGPAGSGGGGGANGAPNLRILTAGYTTGGNVFISNTQPGTTYKGDFWFDTSSAPYPRYISPAVLYDSGILFGAPSTGANLNIPWTNRLIAGYYGVPINAKAVILEGHYAANKQNDSTGFSITTTGFILIRNSSARGITAPYPSRDTYVLSRYDNAHYQYDNQTIGVNQGIFPLRSVVDGSYPIGSLDFMIPRPSSGSATVGGLCGAAIVIIGYYA